MSTLFPSLALSSKEAPAMSLYELNAPQNIHTGGFFSRIGQSLSQSIKAMQRYRMMQVMSELSDGQLDAMGIERADIPSVATRSIYEA